MPKLSATKLARISDEVLLAKLKAFQESETKRTGYEVNFTQAVRTVLWKGVMSIETQPKKGVR